MPIRQSTRIKDAFLRFRVRIDACGRQLMFAGHEHDALDHLGATGGSDRGRLLKKTRDMGTPAPGICLASRGHRQQIWVRSLHSRETLGSPDGPLQTLVVKLIGGGPRRSPAKIRADGNNGILFLHILMDGVGGKASQGKTETGENGLDLVSRRKE